MKKFSELKSGDMIAASVLKNDGLIGVGEKSKYTWDYSKYKYECHDQKWNYFLVDSIDKVWNTDTGEYDYDIRLNGRVGYSYHILIPYSIFEKESITVNNCYDGNWSDVSRIDDIIDTIVVADGEEIKKQQKENGLDYWDIYEEKTN